jgi:hypothetical protein
VAKDVLSYLRYSNSQALLPLLRQYSSSGTLDVADIDPDVLQGEAVQLLNVTQLGEWYRDASQYDVPGSRMLPALPAAAAAAARQESGQVTGRRLLQGTQRHLTLQQQPRQQQQQQQWQLRHVRRLHAAASIPYIPASVTQPSSSSSRAAAAADEAIPTASPEMSLQDMLCAIEPYSPSGLQGMRLPAGNAASSIKCKAPELGLFHHNDVVFRPIVVPIVFHCECMDASLICNRVAASTAEQ